VVKVDAVFSREGNAQRRYVQDAIIERADEVWDLLDNQRANIYVCGNANTMAPGVRTALIQVFQMNSSAAMDGNNWLAGLRAEGRCLLRLPRTSYLSAQLSGVSLRSGRPSPFHLSS